MTERPSTLHGRLERLVSILCQGATKNEALEFAAGHHTPSRKQGHATGRHTFCHGESSLHGMVWHGGVF